MSSTTVKVDDTDDPAEHIDKLSPMTQQCIKVLVKDLLNDEATIVTDDVDGTQKIEYKQAYTRHGDPSASNTIGQPKSDDQLHSMVDSCLSLIQILKKDQLHGGVCLDPTKISLAETKDYQLGRDFTNTGKVLGRGLNGHIVVLKDIKTGMEHARKTMMFPFFRLDEIRCWVELSDTGYVPSIYLFLIDVNKVSIHMEILKDAKTLRSIIDDHRGVFHSSLVRLFALYVLERLMKAVSEMHKRNWVHKDLHSGNAMIQKESEKTLAVKILDFGKASRFDSKGGGSGYRGFKADISEVLRMFSALYCGNEFNDAYDIQTNWQKGIIDIEMDVEENEELMCLVKAGMELVRPDEVKKYRNLVKVKLNNAMGGQQEEIMQKFVSQLFPEDFPNGPTDMDNADRFPDVEYTVPQQVSKNLPPNRANTTGNRDTEASDKVIKQLQKKHATSTAQPD